MTGSPAGPTAGPGRQTGSEQPAGSERPADPGREKPPPPPAAPVPPRPSAPPGPATGRPFPGLAAPAPSNGSFVSDLRALPRRMSVRLRLTLVYGLLFFVAGTLLLVVTYMVVADILNDMPVVGPGDPLQVEYLRRQFIGRTLHELIGRSLLALSGVGIMALMLGYIVAERALAPLQRVTATARKLSESTLHERIALEGPDDEIKELADTFDAMLERLGDAFDTQSRFVANASHELRTPLAINRTLLEVALTDPEASDDLKAVGRTLLATNARHERLIEGLLLLARSERDLTTRAAVDLAEVVRAVLETVREGAGERQIDLHTELTPGIAVGDPVLLEHLVRNLLENAIKHNVDGGEVFVRTGVLDGFAACQVENTGLVVPAYEVERLFEPFRRLHSDRVESAKGAGLGLSIVRSVTHAHRGMVHAAPRTGGGLIVTVRLPPAIG